MSEFSDQNNAPMRCCSVVVKKDRIVYEVEINPFFSSLASQEIVSLVKKAYPNIGQHTCLNYQQLPFSEIASETSLPHLLEHMVIDELVRQTPRISSPYVGFTECVSKAQGRYKIELSFTDDLVALRVFFDALKHLNTVVVVCKHD